MKIYDVRGIGANLTGSFSGSFDGVFTGTLDNVTVTASYVDYTNVVNKPTLISSSAQIGEYGIFATTGSNQFDGSQAITGSLTVTGEVVAQTLNVQQVTSSIVYSSGSNVFGNDVSNTQQFTGSLQVSGSSHYLLGNVGIGTNSPSSKLDINIGNLSTAGAFSDAALNLYNPTNIGAYSQITFGYTVGATYAASYLGFVSTNQGSLGYGDLVFGTRAVNTDTQPTERLRIASDGNVGIGTNDPQSVLNNFSTNARGLAISNAYPFIGLNDTDGGNFYVGTQANLAYMWNGGSDAMVFATNNAERMRITSGGEILMGTTSDLGSYTLQVASSTSSAAVLSIQNTSASGYSGAHIQSSGGSLMGHFGYANASTGAALQDIVYFGSIASKAVAFTTADTERMRITSDGDVRINHTIDFSATFSVKKATGRNIANFSNQVDADLNFTTSEPGAAPFARITPSVSGQPIQLGVNNNNVLIGTTSNIASSRLRVSGNLQIDGFQKMYTYYIIVQPSTTGTITISSPTGTYLQGSMQVMAGGYGNGLTGNITGLWMVGGLLFFNNASTSTITQIVNSVTDFGSMSFQRSGDQYTVTLTNTASSGSSTKTFYVSVIINGD